MYRRGTIDDGFILCFLFNLFFNYWWVVISIVLWVLRLWLPIPIIVAALPLLIWVGISMFNTLLISWAARVSDEPTEPRMNLNPYSANITTIFGQRKTSTIPIDKSNPIGFKADEAEAETTETDEEKRKN